MIFRGCCSGCDGLQCWFVHFLVDGRVVDGLGAGEDVESEVAAAFGPFVVLFGEDGAARLEGPPGCGPVAPDRADMWQPPAVRVEGRRRAAGGCVVPTPREGPPGAEELPGAGSPRLVCPRSPSQTPSLLGTTPDCGLEGLQPRVAIFATVRSRPRCYSIAPRNRHYWEAPQPFEGANRRAGHSDADRSRVRCYQRRRTKSGRRPRLLTSALITTGGRHADTDRRAPGCYSTTRVGAKPLGSPDEFGGFAARRGWLLALAAGRSVVGGAGALAGLPGSVAAVGGRGRGAHRRGGYPDEDGGGLPR